jgi:hypothetical protein
MPRTNKKLNTLETGKDRQIKVQESSGAVDKL